ncbi:hypothetical protein RV08_GL000170 [Enterococcus mundtii]|nr:hypothetical protein RV08_GL000170 [Enterococcus mundtii]
MQNEMINVTQCFFLQIRFFILYLKSLTMDLINRYLFLLDI